MEDIAKAPLNQAHYLDRKAESYAKRQLFEKSIQCRERAIDHLEVTRKLSLTDDTLISIQLQISHHHQQIKNLRERHRQKELKMPSVSRVLDASKPSPRPTSTLFPDIHADPNTKNTKNTSPEKNAATAKSDLESLIRIEILKGDRLLDHLVHQQNVKPDESDAETAAERQKHEMITSAIKLPKPIEQVLEELQCHNDQLKTLMGSLFEEVEALKRENGMLRGKLAEYEKQSDLKDASEEVLPPTAAGGEGLSPLAELPPLAPLEMPEMSALVLKPRVKVPPRKVTVSE